MTDDLRNRIKDFIVSWDNTIEDANWATCDLFLETAIGLLEETLEEK